MEVESKKGVKWEEGGGNERREGPGGGGNKRENVILGNVGFQLVSYNRESH